MGWKTYLVLYFKAGNGKISEIVKKVESVGFSSSLGPVDFSYKWENEPSTEKVLELADKLSEALDGTEVMFNIDTHKAPDNS
ncbi:MAG: hypothetical protein WDZ69_02790 [Candidatus Pacearchaeota archaeon]